MAQLGSRVLRPRPSPGEINAVALEENGQAAGFLNNVGRLSSTPQPLPSPKSNPESFARLLLLATGVHPQFADLKTQELLPSVTDLTEQDVWSVDLARVTNWIHRFDVVAKVEAPVMGKSGRQLIDQEVGTFFLNPDEPGFTVEYSFRNDRRLITPSEDAVWESGDGEELAEALLSELPLISRQIEKLVEPLSLGLIKVSPEEPRAISGRRILEYAAFELSQEEFGWRTVSPPGRRVLADVGLSKAVER